MSAWAIHMRCGYLSFSSCLIVVSFVVYDSVTVGAFLLAVVKLQENAQPRSRYLCDVMSGLRDFLISIGMDFSPCMLNAIHASDD